MRDFFSEMYSRCSARIVPFHVKTLYCTHTKTNAERKRHGAINSVSCVSCELLAGQCLYKVCSEIFLVVAVA